MPLAPLDLSSLPLSLSLPFSLSLTSSLLLPGFQILEQLLAGGAQVNATDGSLASPLHLAARCSSRAVVQLLILNGAPLEQRDCLLMTPLHYAALGDNQEAARLLLHYGADVDATESLGRTPLHLAAERGHCKVFNSSANLCLLVMYFVYLMKMSNFPTKPNEIIDHGSTQNY